MSRTQPPGYENRKNSITYEMDYRCENCRHQQTIDIPKGDKAPIYPNVSCEYCGRFDLVIVRK